jgi:L-lactate dehydrogenase (cytochrome)
LPKIVDAVQGKIPVLMGGGIRSGPVELKALALGAKACFVGRAWANTLGAAAEPGVRDALENLKEELEAAIIHTGGNDVRDASPDLLLKELMHDAA